MSEKSLQEQAHEVMHQIPGMPKHGEAERLNNHGGLPNRPLKNKPLQNARVNHPNRKPKILVGWQKKIAGFFGVEIK